MTDWIAKTTRSRSLQFSRSYCVIYYIIVVFAIDWIAKNSNVWSAENTQRRHFTSSCTVYDRFIGRWLAALLQSFSERFSSHCISDSFAFAKTMQNLDIDPNIFVCFFDVSSLFTNVAHHETIKIYSEALYDKSYSLPAIPNNVFVELMKSATSSVEFSFNSTTYKRKISLISILIHRALMICNKRGLYEKIKWIKKILLHNDHLKNVVNVQIAKKIAQFSTLKRFGPEKRPVHLRVPWVGKIYQNLVNLALKSAQCI